MFARVASAVAGPVIVIRSFLAIAALAKLFVATIAPAAKVNVPRTVVPFLTVNTVEAVAAVRASANEFVVVTVQA
jgi:hypothetical protein